MVWSCETHRYASASVSVFAKTDTIKLLIMQAVSQLTASSSNLAALRKKMQALASILPEYSVVMEKFGFNYLFSPLFL